MPPPDPEDAVDAVVVGSGFGGAVAAARLAQAGLEVVVLERGRRWPAGSFPRNADNVGDRWLWGVDHGLYDVRWLDHMISVQGAGWGGGSLVYANVFLRPPADAFATGWPAPYSRASLDPYFDLVAHMLEVQPVAANPATGHLPVRTVAMEQLVADLSRPSGTVRPHLAVRFTPPDVPVINRHGQAQSGCTFVGECVLGCNVGAKNSLDYNYLALAEGLGARALTESEVTSIAPTATGYAVAFGDHRRGVATSLEARSVFLAAGSVGTTELLLRARDVSQTLPALSPTLGRSFSGNGDYLAFVRSSRTPLDPDEGPTITTSSVVDFDLPGGRRVWFQVQDGGYPRLLDNLLAGLDPTSAGRRRLRAGLTGLLARARVRVQSDEARRRNRMTVLLMGRDAGDGRLTLDHQGEARVSWRNRPNRQLYTAEGQVARLVARSLGGRVAPAPTWRFLRQPVTVHNLGGVPMGESAATGVVDENGEVHGYPGLYVVDGSVLPAATGVNPSATIAAVAERNVERAVRTLTGNPHWRPPEHPDVRPVTAPEDAAMAAMNAQRGRRSGDGVRFAEHLRGTVTSAAGGVDVLELDLTMELPGWRRFRADPQHRLEARGTARCDLVGSPATVRGTLALFPENDEVAMRYLLELTGAEGQTWQLVGTKIQQPRRPLAIAADLTRLRVRLEPGNQSLGETWEGEVRLGVTDVARLALAIRGDAFTRLRRVRAAARFLLFFARGALIRLAGTAPAAGRP